MSQAFKYIVAFFNLINIVRIRLTTYMIKYINNYTMSPITKKILLTIWYYTKPILKPIIYLCLQILRLHSPLKQLHQWYDCDKASARSRSHLPAVFSLFGCSTAGHSCPPRLMLPRKTYRLVLVFNCQLDLKSVSKVVSPASSSLFVWTLSAVVRNFCLCLLSGRWRFLIIWFFSLCTTW